MSGEVRLFVKRFYTHPLVKGNVRALLDAIADLIPEGQVMTGDVETKELAVLSRQNEKTVRRNRRHLRGIVKTHGGGKGKPARYEILGLAGARPIGDGELPLRADLRPVPRARPPATDDAQPDLFGQASTGEMPVPIENRNRGTGETPVLVAGFIGRWRRRYGHFARTVAIWLRGTGEMPVPVAGGTGETPDQILPLDVDGTRARDVHTFKEVHTHAPPPAADDDKPKIRPAPCRWHGSVHAWCDGRVHVPTVLHEEFVRKHSRAAGETDADVEAALFAFYDVTCRALPIDSPVAANDFVFWRKAFAARFASAAPSARDAVRRASPIPAGNAFDYDHPDAVAKRHREEAARLSQERLEQDVEAAIDALPVTTRAFLYELAAAEIASFRTTLPPARYAEAVRAAMIQRIRFSAHGRSVAEAIADLGEAAERGRRQKHG